MILTFHSCSSLIFKTDICQFFSSFLPWMFSSLGTEMSIMRPVCSGSTHQSLLCSRFYSAHMALYTIVCTTCILDLAQCVRSRAPLPWCWGPAVELPWLEPSCLIWCCVYWAINMCGSCLSLLTQLCDRHHAEAFQTRLQLHLALARWLWDAWIQPSAGHFLLSCRHRTSGSVLLGTQHFLCCADSFLLPFCWCIV